MAARVTRMGLPHPFAPSFPTAAWPCSLTTLQLLLLRFPLILIWILLPRMAPADTAAFSPLVASSVWVSRCSAVWPDQWPSSWAMTCTSCYRILREAVLRRSGSLPCLVPAGHPSLRSDVAASPQHSPALTPHPQSATPTHSTETDFKRTTLNCALLNVCSLTNKSFMVSKLIEDNDLDALFITETWLDTNSFFTLHEALLLNYNFLHTTRKGKRGGGVAAIFSDSLNCLQVSLGEYQSL